ncbi:hypothetical protein RM543_14995 [Roseicyclus sp. F158]|uniref:Uncharacterized protein n=1 Tax=Tropicimonas omnivorans TaxID=3075590 RepID=A0ABU3DJU7_9RHOB|nr:hypothetical protein [Roseicyclus sp. F158]MDT0683995.1 hypothetical protein [Roseicyclus sp. F158]
MLSRSASSLSATTLFELNRDIAVYLVVVAAAIGTAAGVGLLLFDTGASPSSVG